MTSDQPDQSFRIYFTGNSDSPTVERINETPPSKTEKPSESSAVEANQHNGEEVAEADPDNEAEGEMPVDPLVVPVSAETRDTLVDQFEVAVDISSAELGVLLAAHLEKELNTEGK